MNGDVVQIAIGTLQGLGASTVFVLVLFIGFCVVVGFTKTKKTAGGPPRSSRASTSASATSRWPTWRRPRRAGRPISCIRRNFSKPPRVRS